MILDVGNLCWRPLFLANILLCFVAIAAGQIAGGMTESTNTRLGGNNYIVGTVFSPTGEPINMRMRIRLITPTTGDFLAMTDDSGKFVFSGLAAGAYTVIIDSEPGIEPVMQQVDIIRNRSSVPETYTLMIRLKGLDYAKTREERPAVIRASNAGVPKRAMKLFNGASKKAVAKDYEGAIEQLKLAIVEYPAFLNAFNEIGVLYLRLNDLNKADEALQAALKIKPDAYEPLINRGIALFRLTRFTDAEALLRDALRVESESAVARYYLGRALHKMGQNVEAEAEFLALVKTSPGEFNEAHRFLAVIYLDRGDVQRVVEELETYLRLVPKAPDADKLKMVIDQIKDSLNSPAK